MDQEKSPFACSLPADELKKRIDVDIRKVVTQAIGLKELEDGFWLSFKATDGNFKMLCGLIAEERQCCSFLSFEWHVPAEFGDFELKISGREGAKELLLSMLPDELKIV